MIDADRIARASRIRCALAVLPPIDDMLDGQLQDLEKALGLVEVGPRLCRQCSARDYTSGLLGQIRGLTAKVERLEGEAEERSAHEACMVTELSNLQHQLANATPFVLREQQRRTAAFIESAREALDRFEDQS